MLPMAVSRSSSGEVTKSQEERATLRVFFPSDNTLYSIAFGTHTKTAEPIEMPFGMSRLVRSNSVLSPKGKGQLVGKHAPDKPNTPNN